jgi:hypothetical protein
MVVGFDATGFTVLLWMSVIVMETIFLGEGGEFGALMWRRGMLTSISDVFVLDSRHDFDFVKDAVWVFCFDEFFPCRDPT